MSTTTSDVMEKDITQLATLPHFCQRPAFFVNIGQVKSAQNANRTSGQIASSLPVLEIKPRLSIQYRPKMMSRSLATALTAVLAVNTADAFSLAPSSSRSLTVSSTVATSRHFRPTYDEQFSSPSKTAVFSAVAAEDDASSDGMATFRKYAQIFCNLFPVWTLITAVSALKKPEIFLGIPPSTFPAQIGMLMLCMGISLKPSDFKRVFQRPGAVLLAFIGCYGVMPALAVAIGKAFQLDPSLAAGLVLVACINGAQASNLCTYIGQGDLALSVLMTTMTTYVFLLRTIYD
jgi:hypothetical protein